MSSLLVWKEKIQEFYANQSVFVDKGIQFILGLISFYLINSNIGLMKAAATPIVTIALAIICTFLPSVFTVLATAALILLHVFKLSMGVAGITALIFIMMFIFYCRFTPKRALILLITPLAFLLKVPFVVPVVCGLSMTPVTAVPIVFGAIVYYIIMCVKNSAAAISGAEGITGQITLFVKTVFQNKELWIMAVAIVLCVFAVYAIRRLSVDYAWVIAIAAGAVINIVVVVAGDMAFNVHTSYGSLILGNLVAVMVGFVLEFFVFSVDYSRTEHIQYEDDEYYYYVKAVPKISIAAPEKTVKRINERYDEDESNGEIRGRSPRRAGEQRGGRRPAQASARKTAGRGQASASERRRREAEGLQGERSKSTTSQSRKSRTPENTDEMLLAKSLREELDIQNIVDKELEDK